MEMKKAKSEEIQGSLAEREGGKELEREDVSGVFDF